MSCWIPVRLRFQINDLIFRNSYVGFQRLKETPSISFKQYIYLMIVRSDGTAVHLLVLLPFLLVSVAILDTIITIPVKCVFSSSPSLVLQLHIVHIVSCYICYVAIALTGRAYTSHTHTRSHSKGHLCTSIKI